MCTTNGALRSTRTLRPLPFVKKTIFDTRGLALPLGLRTASLTRRRPFAGVQRRPASRPSSPSGAAGGGGAGAAGGAGTATGPKSLQPVQLVLAFQDFATNPVLLRANSISRPSVSLAAAAEELTTVGSTCAQPVHPDTASQWRW